MIRTATSKMFRDTEVRQFRIAIKRFKGTSNFFLHLRSIFRLQQYFRCNTLKFKNANWCNHFRSKIIMPQFQYNQPLFQTQFISNWELIWFNTRKLLRSNSCRLFTKYSLRKKLREKVHGLKIFQSNFLRMSLIITSFMIFCNYTRFRYPAVLNNYDNHFLSRKKISLLILTQTQLIQIAYALPNFHLPH